MYLIFDKGGKNTMGQRQTLQYMVLGKLDSYMYKNEIRTLPKVMEIKTKINTWHLIKLTSFCTAKATTNKVKRQFY